MSVRARRAVAIVLVSFPLTACPGGGAGVAPAVLGVTIADLEPRVLLGGTVALQASVQVVGGASAALTWTSDAEGVAAVDAAGVVSGVTVGTAIISAASVADPTRAASVVVRSLARGAALWTRQFGTVDRDVPLAVAVGPAGEVAVGGLTIGTLEDGYDGDGKAFLRVLDATGEVLWTRQFGSVLNDAVAGLAWTADGDLVAAGSTRAGLDDATAFVRRFDPDGGLRWHREFDLAPGVAYDAAEGVAVGPSGEIVVAARTVEDAFVRRLDAAGELCPDACWTRTIATAGGDRATAVAFAPDGRAEVAGHTLGAQAGGGRAGWDAFVRSYPADGGTPWTRQIATAGLDFGWGVAVDALGDVVVTGQVEGLLEGAHAGGADAFVRKYGP